jgi:hypothetical protein
MKMEAKLTVIGSLIATLAICLVTGILFSLSGSWPNEWNSTMLKVFVAVNVILDIAAAWIIYSTISFMGFVGDQLSRAVCAVFLGRPI